jgi:TonB family protein
VYNRQILGALLALLMSFSATVAQDKQNSATQDVITGGVVNGKAAHLVKPSYPPAAKAVRAEGTVNVQVLIDERGDIISASAVSGHPLLRAAAVQAARASKFSPTQLDRKPVKVSGIIVYNFVGEALNTAQIGFALSSAALSSKLSNRFPASQILNSLPTDWIEERKMAAGLIYKQNQEEYETRKDVPNETQQKAQSNKGVAFVRGVSTSGNSEFKNISRTNIANDLTELLKKRYVSNETQIWPFKLGLALGKIHAQIDDDAKLRLNLSYLNQIAATASEMISADLINEIKTLAAIGQKNQIDRADKIQIQAFFQRLRLQ